MPFTLSHVAAVLPFARFLARWRLLCAAIIGSMVPDFGLFLPWRMERFETHSISALLTFCLPVGVATFWIFQRWIKTPVLELLPDAVFVRSRQWAVPAQIGSLRQWILAAGGVLAGAVTHLIWDGFTHEGARGVRMIPALDDPMVDIVGHHLLGFAILQQASSLFGLGVVAWILWRALRQDAGTPGPMPARRILSAERAEWVMGYSLTALTVAAASYVTMRLGEPHGRALHAIANNVAVAGLHGIAASLLLVSPCLHLRLRREPPPPMPPPPASPPADIKDYRSNIEA